MSNQTEDITTNQNEGENNFEQALAEIERLQSKLDLLAAEIEATPTPEARGVAWTDLYGAILDDSGEYHVMKISVTSRSMASPEQALKGLLQAVKAAEEYNLRPYAVKPRASSAVKPGVKQPVSDQPTYQPTEELP